MAERVKLPRSLPVSSQVNKFISDFPDLKYTGTVIYCCVCHHQLNAWSAYACRRHIGSASHIQNRKLKYPYWMFIIDLIFMLSACGIPQWVLEKKSFRSFWNKYNSVWSLPTRQQVRWQFARAKTWLENNIKAELCDKQIWLTMDETLDSKNNKVCNLLIRGLNPKGPSNSYLIASKNLENNSSEAIQQLVMNVLNTFGIQTHNVLMLVSDGTDNMYKAGEMLKLIYPNLLHITCLLHAFHNVAEEIRNCYPGIDKLISKTKMILLNSALHSKKFEEACPGVPDPPQPVSRKWGTWLQAALYYNAYFEEVKSVILTFNSKGSADVKESQQQFNNAHVRQDLLTIHKNYSKLADAIEQFHNSLSLSQYLEIVDQINLTLHTLTDNPGVRVAKKFQEVLSKNPNITELRDINKCLSDGIATDYQQYFAYANVTSVDIERLFSKYASTFTSKRRNLSEDSIETLLMMQAYAENHQQLFMDIN